MTHRGRYKTRLAQGAEDLRAAQNLRHLAFHGKGGTDADLFDAACDHMLIEDRRSGALVCCFRFLTLAAGHDVGRSYSAQFYDLSGLQSYPGRMVEMGRFCIHPDHMDPDILRVAWGAMARFVDDTGVDLLFGCASFAGTQTDLYRDAFAMLGARHLAPKRWLPRVKAPDVFRFAAHLRFRPDLKKALAATPPLLRSYLMMGGWVSDHAVIDRQMNTLHVFTGVEIATIPEARKRALRAVAG